MNRAILRRCATTILGLLICPTLLGAASTVRLVVQADRPGAKIVLTSGKLSDENSIAEPKKVAPVTSPLKGASVSFLHTFEPCSLTVLRLKACD